MILNNLYSFVEYFSRIEGTQNGTVTHIYLVSGGNCNTCENSARPCVCLKGTGDFEIGPYFCRQCFHNNLKPQFEKTDRQRIKLYLIMESDS